jgi:intracellular multiplication protein IcmP
VQQQRSPHEEFIMTTIVFGLIFGLATVIWFFFHEQLTWILRWIRVGEMWIDTLLQGGDYVVAVPDADPQRMYAWRDALPSAKVEEINYPEIRLMTYVAVPTLRPLLAVLLGLMALWTIFRGPGTRFRRRLSLQSLMVDQARSFPAIAPFIKFNPSDMPFRVVGQAVPSVLPLFAEALTPEEWIAFHEVKVQNGQVDLNQAYQALALQLGERWRGPLKLPFHAQALFAAFALRHARKRKDSEALLDQLSLSWTPEHGLRVPMKLKSKIRGIIKDPKLGGALLKYADLHAYNTTALLRCLSRAREEGGVLAPASFLWLRGVDRALWYPMNNLGRKSYHAEAVGALVHYTNELIAGQKIPTPRFEDVIKGIEGALQGPMSRPIPPLDKSAPAGPYKGQSFKLKRKK